MADQSVHIVQMLSANHTVQRVQRLAYICFELHGHMREHPLPRIQSHSTADTAVNRTLLKAWESHLHLRALQGVGLLSSHTESLLPSFSLSSLSALLALLCYHQMPSFSLSRLCFSLPWLTPGLETLWNKYTVAKCTDIETGSCDCTQNSWIK